MPLLGAPVLPNVLAPTPPEQLEDSSYQCRCTRHPPHDHSLIHSWNLEESVEVVQRNVRRVLPKKLND